MTARAWLSFLHPTVLRHARVEGLHRIGRERSARLRIDERVRPFRMAELQRTYTHASLGRLSVDRHLHFFGWHTRHHLAQITTLRDREGW